jgi:hypothetical protein
MITTNEIPWELAPEGFDFAAIDADGQLIWYTEAPLRGGCSWTTFTGSAIVTEQYLLPEPFELNRWQAHPANIGCALWRSYFFVRPESVIPEIFPDPAPLLDQVLFPQKEPEQELAPASLPSAHVLFCHGKPVAVSSEPFLLPEYGDNSALKQVCYSGNEGDKLEIGGLKLERENLQARINDLTSEYETASPKQEPSPLSDEQLRLLAYNCDEGGWDSLQAQKAWLQGFVSGSKYWINLKGIR